MNVIIGAGGIGSHFCRILHRMLQHRQLGAETIDDFVVYDFDIVEPKNCQHQDFTLDELGVPKSVIMNLRFGFKNKVDRFVEEDLPKFERYIICADNPAVRKLVFEHCKKANKLFVDMRAEGDMFAVFTEKMGLPELLASLGDDKTKIEGVSCQRMADQAKGLIQIGNFFAAPMGIDVLLRQYRGVTYPGREVRAIV